MKKLLAAICCVFLLTACDAKTAGYGDTVKINFAGFLDGVQFPGGTASDYPLTLGSGQFIPGFEEQLVGAKPGEERDVKVRFPDQYQAKNLAGKEVIFKVKVLEIESK